MPMELNNSTPRTWVEVLFPRDIVIRHYFLCSIKLQEPGEGREGPKSTKDVGRGFRDKKVETRDKSPDELGNI